jgi:hypothetical protein
MEVNGGVHSPAALPLGKEPLTPIGWEAGWAPEPVWTMRRKEKFFSLPGIESRLPDHPARSQSLYRLMYPGSYAEGKLFQEVFRNILDLRNQVSN